MADFIFEIFPGRLLGILFGSILGKGAHCDPGLRLHPLFHLCTGVLGGLILPEEPLALRALRQEQLVPPERGVTVLPINRKGSYLCPRASMHRPIQILGPLLPSPVCHHRLLPKRIPAPP
jgi:hypothetical protein